MLYYPHSRHPNVFVHSRGNGTYHPTVSVAGAHLFSYSVCLFTVPQFIPALLIQVAHNLFVFCTVARHHISVWVYKEGVKTHIAGEKPFLTVYVVDESVVEICTKPFFWAVGFEQLIDQFFKILCYHRSVVDFVLSLYKVKAVVQ